MQATLTLPPLLFTNTILHLSAYVHEGGAVGEGVSEEILSFYVYKGDNINFMKCG